MNIINDSTVNNMFYQAIKLSNDIDVLCNKKPQFNNGQIFERLTYDDKKVITNNNPVCTTCNQIVPYKRNDQLIHKPMKNNSYKTHQSKIINTKNNVKLLNKYKHVKPITKKIVNTNKQMISKKTKTRINLINDIKCNKSLRRKF